MPELPIKITDRTSAAVRAPSQADGRRILREAGMENPRSGTESLVYVHPRDPTKVIALSRLGKELDPLTMKQVFYTHKILEMLFPNNFPVIHSATGKDIKERNHAGTVRERVSEYTSDADDITFPFANVLNTFDKLGVDLVGSKLVDMNGFNFIIGQNGEEFYVDLVSPLNASNQLQEKIGNHMRANSYSEGEIRTMYVYMQRIMELQRMNQDGLIQNK